MNILETGLLREIDCSLCKHLTVALADGFFADHKAGYGMDDR